MMNDTFASDFGPHRLFVYVSTFYLATQWQNIR